MIKLIAILTCSFILNFHVTAEEYSEDQYKEIFDTDFESVTKGMTPEMKERYKAQMELAKKEFDKYMKLSPEEREKREKETEKAIKDPNNAARIKENFNNMPKEDKAMLQIMVKNLNNEIDTAKNPPLKKPAPNTILKTEKLSIQPGTPNLLMIPDEKLSGFGNNNIKELKENYSKLIEKMNELNKLEVNTYCSDDTDCMSMSYGQRLNGGPAGFIIMSKNDINAKALMTRVNNFTELDKQLQINLKGFTTLEKKKEWPIINCMNNQCRLKP